MTRLAVTGASGRLGRMFANWLERTVPAELEVDLFSRGARPDWGIRGPWTWRRWPDPKTIGRADVILHLAGLSPTKGAPPTEAALHAANVDFAIETLVAAQSAQRVLMVSSASVYGAPMPGAGPISEDAALRPAMPYARSKQRKEEALAATDDGRVAILRVGNVAGADQLIQNALHSRADDPIKLDRFADGRSPVRSYIGPDDLAAVFVRLAILPGPLPAVLNVAAPEPVEMEDLLRALLKAGHDVHWRDRKAPDGAIARVQLDCTRLESLMSLPAGVSLPERMISQMRKPLKS